MFYELVISLKSTVELLALCAVHTLHNRNQRCSFCAKKIHQAWHEAVCGCVAVCGVPTPVQRERMAPKKGEPVLGRLTVL